MNKKLRILNVVFLTHGLIFSMGHDTAPQRALLHRDICRLQAAITQAACFDDPESNQNVEVARLSLKRRFPQVVEILPDGKARIFKVNVAGKTVIYTM